MSKNGSITATLRCIQARPDMLVTRLVPMMHAFRHPSLVLKDYRVTPCCEAYMRAGYSNPTLGVPEPDAGPQSHEYALLNEWRYYLNTKSIRMIDVPM